jgi:3-hydroxybutyryl-CoA dehydratase
MMEIKSTYSIDEIEVGMFASYSQTITDSDIKAYAGLSGDHNPVHVSDEYATQSRYRKRIAHGMISSAFFSALFGTKLPGRGCVYVSQSLFFKNPVYLGDTVLARVEVIKVDKERKRVFFDTTCLVGEKKVITGEAEIYIP